MRRHAKASSAGSTMGRGASARFAVLSLLALAALVAFATAGASAKPQVTEHYASFGPDGTESSNFERINGVAVDQQTGVVYVLDGKAGTLAKFDEDGTPLPFSGTAPYIEDGVITGISINRAEGIYIVPNQSQLAVDSSSHVVYVTEANSIRAFHADGEAAKFSAGPGKDTNEIPGFGEATGVAVDVNGAIYVSDLSNEEVSIFALSGAPLATFEATEPGNLAVAPGGAVYVSRLSGASAEIRKFTPSEFPVTSATTYTDSSFFEAFALSGGVGVDPLNGDVYVFETTFQGSGNDIRIRKLDSAGNFLRFFGGPDEEEERFGGPTYAIGILGGGEEFQFYVGDTAPVSEVPYSKIAIFGEEIIEGPPAINSTTVDDVTANTAVLNGQVNPNTAATTYHFEYGSEDCAVSACTSVPLGDGQIPAGHIPVSISEAIFGLAPGTTYHYRIVAENSFSIEPTEGPDRTFTTQVSGLGFALADSRAWEMVTPPDKHGAGLFSGEIGAIQASADGNGFAYVTSSSIEADPESSRAFESVSAIARRGAKGWSSKDIMLPHESVAGWAGGYGPEYRLFNADLSKAILDPRSTTPFSPEASERTPYIRENTEPATYTPLVTGKEGFENVPPGTEFGGNPNVAYGPVSFAGATADFSHVVVRSNVPLAAGAGDGGLYAWSDGELRPVSVLPASEGGAIVRADTIGASVSSGGQTRVIRNAISSDGSRVFWTPVNDPRHLYMRDTVAAETVRLDTLQGGSGAGSVGPIYQGASADGSVVFFTDTQQLTPDASTKGADLYRCELPLGGMPTECATLTDISPPTEGSGESAEVQGIVSALGANATMVYFAAKGVLDSTPNAHGDSATPKQPNLYLWQEGAGTRFIATLSKNDGYDWGDNLGTYEGERNLSAAASPSGRYFAFMSERSLTGEDNLDVASGKPLQQAFRYDAATEELICISCNPTGASPHGKRLQLALIVNPLADPLGIWEGRLLAASMPQGPMADYQGGTSYYRPRYVFDSGRIFFHSFDALVPADSNGNWDVYQYEPTGVGDCTASSGSAAISRSAGGCVALVSSGSAEGESAFFDASETGDDVFFVTTAKLSVLDTDSERDIYDARVNGVVAKLTPRTECQGETCLPAPSPPNDPTPSSASFSGAGNLASERCPASKRKVMRNGNPRCVAKKHKKKRSHKAKRAANNRRAGR